jgi:drug/metabolite transporter (DMT)-like permease
MNRQLKGDLGLLGVTLLWGTSFPIMKVFLKDIPPYSFIAIRYFLSAIILAIIFNKKIRNINKDTIKAGIFIGLPLCLGSILQILGLLYTTPSKSGFITGFSVIFVPIFLAIIYKKFPDRKTIYGAILSIIGLGIMCINIETMSFNKGDFLTLISAVAFAIQIILVDRFIKKDVDIIAVTCLELLVTGALSFLPAIVIEKMNMNINVYSAAAIIFTILFCTIGAYGMQNKMQSYTTPTHAAIIFLGEPVFSAFFSTFIGDRLTPKVLIGCIFILVGMCSISIKFKSTNDKQIV